MMFVIALTPHYFVNYIELIAKLTQIGTFADYHRQFESMLNHIQGLPESTLLPIYLGGLRQPIKNQVRFQHPHSVAAAMALAHEFDSAGENHSVASRRPWQGRDQRGTIVPPTTHTEPSKAAVVPPSTAPNARLQDFSKLPVVRLSAAEKAERNRLGLC